LPENNKKQKRCHQAALYTYYWGGCKKY